MLTAMQTVDNGSCECMKRTKFYLTYQKVSPVSLLGLPFLVVVSIPSLLFPACTLKKTPQNNHNKMSF